MRTVLIDFLFIYKNKAARIKSLIRALNFTVS